MSRPRSGHALTGAARQKRHQAKARAYLAELEAAATALRVEVALLRSELIAESELSDAEAVARHGAHHPEFWTALDIAREAERLLRARLPPAANRVAVPTPATLPAAEGEPRSGALIEKVALGNL